MDNRIMKKLPDGSVVGVDTCMKRSDHVCMGHFIKDGDNYIQIKYDKNVRINKQEVINRVHKFEWDKRKAIVKLVQTKK